MFTLSINFFISSLSYCGLTKYVSNIIKEIQPINISNAIYKFIKYTGRKKSKDFSPSFIFSTKFSIYFFNRLSYLAWELLNNLYFNTLDFFFKAFIIFSKSSFIESILILLYNKDLNVNVYSISISISSSPTLIFSPNNNLFNLIIIYGSSLLLFTKYIYI